VIDVLAERVSLEARQPGPPLDEHGRRSAGSLKRSKLGNSPSVARDRQTFTPFNPLDDLATMVTQLADRDLAHLVTVSRVRRTATRLPLARSIESDACTAAPVRAALRTRPPRSRRSSAPAIWSRVLLGRWSDAGKREPSLDAAAR
jgi:hypothetical protein